MGDIYRTYFEQRRLCPEQRVVDGEYVSRPAGMPRTHDQNRPHARHEHHRHGPRSERYFLYDTVFDAVHAQGGLSGYAHINSGNFHVHRDMSLNMPRGKVDFAEILQFNNLARTFTTIS